MTLAFAQRLSARIHAELAPFCERIEIAGSIRRRRPECGDIDVVCLPKRDTGRHDIIRRCLLAGRCVKTGEQYRIFMLKGDVQLDLWFAHAGDTDLLGQNTFANFASLLVCRTGSAMFNVWLAQRAQERHLHWHPHAGLMHVKGRAFVDYRDSDGRKRGGLAAVGDYIDTPTEEALFAALGLDYIKPEDRER